MVVLGMKPALCVRCVLSTFALACVLRTACVPASKATPAPWGRLKPALHVRFMHVNSMSSRRPGGLRRFFTKKGQYPRQRVAESELTAMATASENAPR